MKFDHLGVFTYSEEEGTIAADLEDNISRELKDERKAIIMDIQNNINYEKNSAMVGQTQKVIIDEVGETVAVGRTEYDSPEIDNIVQVDGKVSKGEFYNVKINNFNEYELIGCV